MTKAKPFNDRYEVDPITECWNFTGCRTGGGYGGIKVDRKNWFAHRYSWFLVNGPIPAGMFVLHHCDNRRCVNPGHLFLGTHQDNSDDKVLKGRQAKSKGILNGNHKLTEDEVRIIRSLQGKQSSVDIAAIYGVSYTAIYKIWTRKTWKHIE